MDKKTQQIDPVGIRVAVLTVSDTRDGDDDRSGDLIVERLLEAGHSIAAREIIKDEFDQIQAQIKGYVDDEKVDVVIATGGTGVTRRDVTPDALKPLITKHIPGFGELFRMLSFEEIGSSTIQSRADAGLCDDTLVFVLPGSPGACRLAMDKILINQLDVRHKPCNFVELLPRIKLT